MSLARRDSDRASNQRNDGACMTAAHEIDRVVERIKKLLALTSSQNPNEAALAASKAQELLFRHNLSMAMVEAATEGGNSAYVADRFDSGGWMHWRRRLL